MANSVATRSAASKNTDWLTKSTAWLIGILAVFTVLTITAPFPQSVPRHKVVELQERAVMKGLELAVRGYQTEYAGILSLNEFWTSESEPIPSEGEILQILSGENEHRNPRKIIFWEGPTAEQKKAGRPGVLVKQNGTLQLVDRNNGPFWLVIDLNGDGMISNPDPQAEDLVRNIESPIIIYSAGKDGDLSTWKDNVKSWND